MDHMSYNKKNKKKNAAHLDFLNNLVDSIMGETKEVKIEELAKKYNISICFDPNIICQIDSIKTKTGTMTDREIVALFIISHTSDAVNLMVSAGTDTSTAAGIFLLILPVLPVYAFIKTQSKRGVIS